MAIDDPYFELNEALAAAQNGDRAAFARLVELTKSGLFRTCLLLTGDRAHAEDLLQNAYIRAFSAIADARSGASFVAWLRTICRNLFLDSRRKRREEPLKDEQVIEHLDGMSSQEDKEFYLQVHQALAALSSEDRMVLLLVDREGHSYDEAAAIMGLTLEAIRSRVARARKKFVKCFEEA